MVIKRENNYSYTLRIGRVFVGSFLVGWSDWMIANPFYRYNELALQVKCW